MTYAEKLIEEFSNKYNANWHDEQMVISKYGIYIYVYDVEKLIEKAMQDQREADIHLVSEILKEHGIGGLQYDSIQQAILNAEVKI
jgi:hypothetical protein